MIIVDAPAKVNLTLEVIGRRDDGFHEISSIIQAVGLWDRLSFMPATTLEFSCASPQWTAAESLVSRAAMLLREATGCTGGARVSVIKEIPLRAGLGGDSSAAAATLKGLNELWKLQLSRNKLAELAAQLGSDVTFFLYGGTACLHGRGELVQPLASPAGGVVILVPPLVPAPGKTGLLYSCLGPEHYRDGVATEQLRERLGGGRSLVEADIYNVFDSVVTDFFGLDEWHQMFRDAGAEAVHVAGSGPALFSFFSDQAQAEAVYQRLCDRGQRVYLAPFLSG